MDWIRLSGMAAGPSVLSACTIASAFFGLVGRAEAHAAPFGTAVYANGTQLVLRMSRGLVLRSAQPPDYRFVCNEALGVAEYDAASVLVRADRSLLVGTSTGLKQLSADGCTIEALAAFGEARVSSLVRDPRDETRVYAATDAGLYESQDEGGSFVQLDAHAFDSLEVPEDMQGQLFATGQLPSPPGNVHAYVARWHKGAALEMHDFALEANEYAVTLLGSDSEHVIAVARAYLGTPYPDRLLISADGARSWQTSLSAPDIAAFAVERSTGAWLIGAATGLWRISASGEPPAQRMSAAVSCLSQQASGLYSCDGSGPHGGVSMSVDGGERWKSVLRWNQVAGLAACSLDAPAVKLCQAAWQDWAREVAPILEPASDDAGRPAHAEDGGDAAAQAPAPTHSSAAGCAALSGDTHARWLWLVLLSIFSRTLQRLRAKRVP